MGETREASPRRLRQGLGALRREPQEEVYLDVEALVRTCPNCSAALDETRCKLICPRCHYYMSCSDYY